MNVSGLVKEWVEVCKDYSSRKSLGLLTPPKEFVKMNQILPSWDLSQLLNERKASCMW